jgi:O-antigen ligase
LERGFSVLTDWGTAVMSQSIESVGEFIDQGPPARDRVSIIWILLSIFILGTVTVSPLEGWNYLVKGIGVVLAAAFLINSIRTPASISAEMILFIAWLTWALTGVFAAESSLLFWYQWTTTFQIWVLLVIVAGFTSSRRALSLNMLSFLIGVIVLGGYSYLTGEYARAEAREARVSGLAVNANQFGWLMFLATVALMYFWMLPTRLGMTKYILLAAGLLATGGAAVLSGSRTAMAGLGAFYVCWLWFCYRKSLRREPFTVAVTVVAVVVLGVALLVLMERTGALDRFADSWRSWEGQRTTEGSTATRMNLLRLAWELLWEYPVTGVGLGNFRIASKTFYVSHSEFAEVAVSTGLPGFLMYFAVFYVLWRRTGRLAKYSTDPAVAQTAGLIRATILATFLMGLGRWNYNDKAMWVVFGSFIGYTVSAWNELRARLPQAPERTAV